MVTPAIQAACNAVAEMHNHDPAPGFTSLTYEEIAEFLVIQAVRDSQIDLIYSLRTMMANLKDGVKYDMTEVMLSIAVEYLQFHVNPEYREKRNRLYCYLKNIQTQVMALSFEASGRRVEQYRQRLVDVTGDELDDVFVFGVLDGISKTVQARPFVV